MENAAQGRSRGAGNGTHDITYRRRPRDLGGRSIIAGLCVDGHRTLDRLAPWYIATGYFTKYGLKVNIVNFEQDADRNAALWEDRRFQHRYRQDGQFSPTSGRQPSLLLVDDSNGANKQYDLAATDSSYCLSCESFEQIALGESRIFIGQLHCQYAERFSLG